jgi:hypothetical protein
MSKELLLGIPAGTAIGALSASKAFNALKGGGNLKNNPLAIVGGVVALGAVGTGTAAVFKKGHRPMFIEEGFVGVRTRRGQPIYHKSGDLEGKAKIEEAGFAFALPLINSLRIVSIQDRSLQLGRQEIERTDGQYTIDASIIWGINPELADRSIFRTDSLIAGVGEKCQGALRVAAMAVEKSMLCDPNLQEILLDMMKQESQDALDSWGAELRGLNLASFARTPGQMNVEGLAQLSRVGGAVGLTAVNGLALTAAETPA